MSNSIPSPSSSSCPVQTLSSPSQSHEVSTSTTTATQTLAKKLISLPLEASSILHQVTVQAQSYLVCRLKEHRIYLLSEFKNSSTVQIYEEGLKKVVSLFHGEVVLNELLETFLKGNKFFTPNSKIARYLFLFGAKHGIRFRIQLLDALRSTGFGFSETPQLTIKSKLNEHAFQTSVCTRSELLCLLPTRKSFPTLIETLKTDKTIVGLEIEEIENTTRPLENRQIPILLNTLTKCSQLSSLSIRSYVFDDINAAIALAAHITNNSSLTCLRLYYTDITIDGATEILRAMSSNSSITTLEISSFQGCRDASKERKDALKTALANMIRCNTTLSDFTFIEDEFNSNKVIAQNIIHNTSLTRLTSEKSYRLPELLQALKHNTTLTELNAGNISVNTSCLEKLVELIEVNTTLRNIDMHAYPVFNPAHEMVLEDEDGEALARALSKNTALNTLNIHNIDMSDLTAHRILAGLGSNTTLQKLHFFQRKNFEDSNPVVRSIQELFLHNSTLTDLSYQTRSIPPLNLLVQRPRSKEELMLIEEYRKYEEYEPVTIHTERAKANEFQRNLSLFQLLFDNTMLEVV